MNARTADLFRSFRTGFRLSLSKKVAPLLLALAGSAWTAGCTCADTGIVDSRFTCSTGADCAEGYFCDTFAG
jgi:hypothetical protein